MNEHNFEKRLEKLNPASASDDFLTKGQQLIKDQMKMQRSESFWHRHLMQLLGTALTLSIAVNVVQLVAARSPTDSSNDSQMAQCNTPVVSVPNPTDESVYQYSEFTFANNNDKPKPSGFC